MPKSEKYHKCTAQFHQFVSSHPWKQYIDVNLRKIDFKGPTNIKSPVNDYGQKRFNSISFTSLSNISCSIHVPESTTEFCEDRSTTIEKGYVNCTTNNVFTYNYFTVRCEIACLPGYVPHPQAQITCSSSGTQVLRIDANGQRSYVTTGIWSGNVSTAECKAPTSCPTFNAPRHGSKICTSKDNAQTCLRTCQYPYEMSEPLYQREHCGPETNFFWSHVIRNNSTEVPPCFFPQKCRALQHSDWPEHGQMRCKNETWANTTICKLDCERGYVPKDNNKTEVFCGPTTAFIWSHVHMDRNSSARIEGCAQSPITTEVKITSERPCDSITASEKEENAEKLNSYLSSRVLDKDENSNFTFIGWNSYCKSSTTTPSGEKNGTTVNITVSEMTYSLYYKTLCSDGQCKEACRVLNLTHNQLCVDICLSKVGRFQSSLETQQQVKILQTKHVGKLMAEVDFPTGVSTALKHMNGAKFKSLNVTTISMKTYDVTEYQARTMGQQMNSYSISSQDRC